MLVTDTDLKLWYLGFGTVTGTSLFCLYVLLCCSGSIYFIPRRESLNPNPNSSILKLWSAVFMYTSDYLYSFFMFFKFLVIFQIFCNLALVLMMGQYLSYL